MPIYTSGGKTYNIPDEKAEKFEASHPDAKVTIYTGGKRYNIPIGKQSKFKAQFAEWSYDLPSQPAAPQTKPVATTMAAQASMQPQVEQKPTNVPTQPTVNTEGSNMVDSAREYANANAQAQLMEDSGKVAETMAKQPLVKSDTTTPDSNVQNMPVEPVKVQPKQNTLVDTDEINEQYAPDKVLGIEDEVSSLDDAPKQEHEPLSEEDAEYTRKYYQEHEGYDIYEYIPDTFKVANQGKTETQIIAEWFNIADESKHQYLQQQQTQEREKAEVADSLMRSQQNWLPEEAAAWRAKTIAQTEHDPYQDVPQTFVAKFPEGTSEDEIYWAWTHENDASKDEWELKDKTLYVDNIYTRAKAKQQEDLKAENAIPSYSTTTTGAIGTDVAKGLEDTRRLSTQTIRAIDKANELLEAYKAHQGDENFFVGAFKGFRDGISDIDNWVGVYMLGQMTALQDIMAKQEAGEELTQEEQDLVDALAYQMAVEASVADELGWGYTSGKTTGASLPFMLQMIASPATSATNAALKGLDKVAVFLGKNAVKKFGRSVLKKMLAKKATRAVVRGLYKVGKSKVGKAVATTVTGTPRAMIEGSIQTVLFHTDRVTADAIDRQMGNEMLVERANELFGTQMEAREGKEWTRSVLEAFATQASENVTEYLGTRVFDPIGGMIGRALAPLEAKAVGTMFKVADKMGVGDVVYRLVNLPKSQFLTGLAGRGQWNGLFGEYLEEVVNNGVNVLLGNMDAEDFVSLEQNAETLLGLAWTSLGFGVANGVSRVKQYAKAQEDINHVLRAAELAWADNKQEWESWKARIDEMSYDELREEMRRLIVANSMATAEQRGIARERTRLAMRYMLCRSQLMGLDATSEELREASTRTPSWMQAEDAQADGIVADEEGQADIVAELTEAHQVLTEASGMDAQAFVGQYGQSADEQLRHIEESPLDANTKAAAKAYILANERYEGVAAVAEAEIERKVRAAEEEVRANINPETNTVIRVSMKTGNEEGKVIDVEAYVIAGNINESGAVTLRMADGSQQMVQANKLTLVSETEADMLLEGAREAARQEAVAEVAGRMSNHVASQVEMPMEVGHRVVVNGEHGSIVATDGQVTRVQLDNGTEVDFTAEAVYDEAQYNKVSERSARAKEHVAEVVVNDKRSNEVPTPMRAPKAEAQIPTDTNGAKQYDQADPQVAWESILAKAKGNAKVAQAVIAEEIEILQSQVQALESASIPVVDNMDQRIEMHMQRQAEIDAINDKIARWQEVAGRATQTSEAAQESVPQSAEAQEVEAAMYAAEQERINRLIPTLDDVSTGETTAEEFVAGLFGAKGIRITPDSFRRETGLGTEEQRRLVGIIAGKDKGGVSIERAAEIIMDNYSSELEARGFTGDSSDVRGIIIDILGSGNPRAYAKQASLMRAEKELSQQMEEFDRYTQEAYHMSAEEYITYEESMLPLYLEQYKDFDETEFFNNFVDDFINFENYDNSRESTAVSRSSEVLHEEQSSVTRGDSNATEGGQGGTLQGNVQGETQNGPSPESSQQIAKEHNAQIDVARLAEETGVSKEEIKQVIDFANKVGVKLKFAAYTTTEQGALTNGEAYANKREITISKLMLSEGKSLRWIMGHELTHIVKTQGTQEEWEAFRDFIKNTIGEKSWKEGIESRTKLYKEAYKNQSVAGFEAAMEEELCADQAGYIFFDANNVDRFLGVPRTLAQKIYDWFRGLVSNVPNNVKVAVELWGQMAKGNVEVSTDEQGKKHSIVGVTGARALDKIEHSTRRMDNLTTAKEMATVMEPNWSDRMDKSAHKIWLATGWDRGTDGMWRYELVDSADMFDPTGMVDYKKRHPNYERYLALVDKSNSGEALTEKEQQQLAFLADQYGYDKLHNSSKLKDYLDFDELYDAYPELKNINIRFVEFDGEKLGNYNRNNNTITLANRSAEEMASVLFHEVQHAIQAIEGFARGGNLESAGSYDNYQRLAGEVEARNVQERLGGSAKKRKQIRLGSTEDIDREEQTVKRYSITQSEAEQLAETENATRYSIVVDPQLIAELEASPKRKGYRNVVQREDGLFEAPMGNSLRGNGITVENTPFAMGQWEQSEEHPELVYGDNKITLVKPDGKTVADVNYNPYIHNRLNTLNAQFKQAWERPDLVYIETEVPVTDLEGGYMAEHAHLSTGIHQWSNGALMLSRYDKPVRIVPWDEVAIPWIEKYKKSGVHFDIVPPALRPILAEAGVEIKEPHANMGEKCTKAYEEWKAEQEAKYSAIKPIGQGYFGNIYDQFKGKPKEAIEFLMRIKEGEAIGALTHPEIGEIDLVWGKEGTGKSDGFGLAKLVKFHPEVLENLQDILDGMHIVTRSSNRVNLESDTHKASVRLTWDNQRKNWLLTAFEKKNSVSDNTTDTDETSLRGKQNDTATLQDTVFKNKDTQSVSTEQAKTEENSANVAESNVDVTNEEVKKNSITSVNSITEAAGRLEENVGEVDTEKGDVRYSVHDILRGKERENAIKDLMAVTGRNRATVLKWLKAEESLAKVILDEDNVALLDIEADESVPSIWNNSDYPQGTVEFSNICKKRLPFTTIYQRLQKEYPNMVFDAQTLNTIRETMKDAGKDVACALCFVEDRRQLLGEIGQGFIDAVQGNGAKLNDNQKVALNKLAESGDRYVPNLYDILTLDGMKKLRKEHPAVAQAFIEYNNARGMQAGRLFQAYSAYNREILKYSDKKVKSINDNGGLRIFSFSDFEAHHLIDLVQVLTDCAAKGIKVQGDTKVPAFAKAVKDTGAKINRSLIPKGVGYVDADYVPKEGEAVSPNVINGKRLLFDTVEGIDVNDPNFFDSTSSKSVGNILVVINDEHARIAMADPFVDYLIGFHTGQAKEILKGKGIDTWVNYKNDQMDKVETTDKNGNKKLTNAPNHGINIYTDVLNVAEAEGNPIKTAKQFTERFLEECNKRGYVPRFYRFLNRAKDGRFLYTPGYHKFLPDFKLFDKNGKILTQEPVMPIFDNEFNKQILEDYVRDVKEELPLDNVYEAVKEAIGLGEKKFSINDNNVASHIYNMDATRAWMWVLRNSPKGVRAKGYGYIDKDRLEEFQDWYDIYLDRGAEEYIQALEELKNKATKKAQEYIDEVIAGVEKHRDDFRRLAEGDDSVLSTSNAAKFSITAEHKQKQLDIISESNPVGDDYHTWIRTVDDIKSFEEALDEPGYADFKGEDLDPSYTWEMVEDALQSGRITVYSSKPIKNGNFVTPSRMEAESYAGNGKVYKATLPLQDIAWIDPTQGQVAKVDETKFSISAESQKIFDTAKAEYGTTEDFGLAGYMLPDGDLLDFSNGSGARTLDHRNIRRVYPDVEHDSRWEYVVDFMNDGAIRLVPESGIIQMTQQPTLEQRKKLKEYIRQENGYVIVEINNANGNSQAYKEYDEGTTPNNVLADIDRYFDEGIRFSLSAEEQSIIDTAKANGTYMLAPNGEPSNLNEKQWAQVRTKAFKEWFGDWEKILRIEKLRGSNPIVVEFNGEYELNRDSAKQWMKDNLRGEYINADTGENILLSKVGINEVTAHGSKDEAHLKSLSAIPSMIEGAVFIDELVNSKGHDKYDSYRYYVCGLVIDGVDYTAKIVVGVKDGSRYYDHRLTEIEKGTLLDNLNGLSNSVVDMQNTSSSVGKDTKLISILQTNSSKIVDENGEPMVVYHYTPNEFTEFDTEKIGSSTDVGAFGTGFYLSPSDGFSLYGKNKMALFVNAKNPMRLNDSNAFDAKEPFFKKDYEWTKESAQAFADDVQAKGYDAVYYENRGMDEIVAFNPTQIKSATDNVGTFDAENGDIRYSMPVDILAANERFNEELDEYIKQGTKANFIFHIGQPLGVMKIFFPELPIVMRPRVINKASNTKHDVDATSLYNLPQYIAEPIFVFQREDGAIGILTEMMDNNGKNVCVAVELNKKIQDGGTYLDVNDIRSIHGRDVKNIVLPIIHNNTLKYADKEKALDWFSSASSIYQQEITSQELSDATKIVQDFQNPPLPDDESSQNVENAKSGEQKYSLSPIPGRMQGESFIDYAHRVAAEVERQRQWQRTGLQRALALNQYEERVASGWYQTQEALQDSMLGLKALMQSIVGDGTYIEDIPDHENPYMGENRLSSVNQAEAELFAKLMVKPMLEEVSKLARNDEALEELTDYVMAKHGLERNLMMAAKEAQQLFNKKGNTRSMADLYSECRKKDYAGLTALTGEGKVADAEAKAQDMVDAYEAAHYTDALWDKINALNNAILLKQKESGMLSEKLYKEISGMYDYYIPLRGFDETTIVDVYAYLDTKPMGEGAVQMRAKGRRSKADSPWAFMQSMADQVIMQGNRNKLVKQKLLNFVMNHPSDAVSISRVYLKYNADENRWEMQSPKFDGNETEQEKAAKWAEFASDMEDLSQQHPSLYKTGREAVNMKYKVPNQDMLGEHQVLVRTAVGDFVITVQGNPRAAQAANGLTNPDNPQGWMARPIRYAESINRHLSNVYTSANPDFVYSNWVRDSLFGNTMVWIKESPRYAAKFHLNWMKYNPVRVNNLLNKWENNELDMSDPTEAMFYEFMLNGGETGYTSVRDIEAHKDAIKKELKKVNSGAVRSVLRALIDKLTNIARGVENGTRFAAYVTSMEEGRGIGRSIWDAKEISVNFNKKGAGARFVDKEGQTVAGNAAGVVSGFGRSLHVFWNAALQGTTNFGRQAKRHPVKALTALSTMYGLGYLVAMASAWDDDDDKKEGELGYLDIPEYTRRSNIVIKTVAGHWLTVPLPIEYRAVYGMGELCATVMSGKVRMSDGELAGEIAKMATQAALPVDIFAGDTWWMNVIIPSFAAPIASAYRNVSWTGVPIYKETPFNEAYPEWTKAYKGADRHLVEATRWLSDATGGNKSKSGWVDLNPAQIEYILDGYLGGWSTMTKNLVKTGEMVLGKREYDARNIPIWRRMFTMANEHTENRNANEMYWDMKKVYDEVSRLQRDYEKYIKNGESEYIEKLNALRESQDFKVYQKLDQHMSHINDLNRRIKEAKEQGNSEEEKNANVEFMILKKRIAEEINKMLDDARNI